MYEPSYEPSNFRELSKMSTETTSKEPECFSSIPEETFERNNLTNKEMIDAKKELLNKQYVSLNFPKTSKMNTDPPINGQLFTIISFIPSPKATPDPEGCYGLVKIRGTFESLSKADKWGEYLIRNHDSYAVLDYTWVGKYFPLMTNNEMYRRETREIDIRKKNDEIVKDNLLKQRKKDKQDMDDVQKRQEELMRDVDEDKENNFDDLDFYVQLRTKKAHLMYTCDEMKRKISDSSKLVDKVVDEISSLDVSHPEYKDQFLERYRSALSAAGIRESDSPLIKYML